MKFRTHFVLFALLSVGLGALGCGGGPPSVDLGDQSTGNLLWGAVHYGYEEKDLDKALIYADAALELHGAEARKQQASLSGFPLTDPPEITYEYKTLNNVGMVALVRGDMLMLKGDRAGAKEAFTMLVEDLGYAQAQDRGEWRDAIGEKVFPTVPRDERGFFSLAEAARVRLADIEAGRD